MRKLGFLSVLLVMVGSLLWFGGYAKASGPAFRERDIWQQSLATSTNLLGTSLTPLTRGTISTPTVGSCTYRFSVALTTTSSIVYLRVRNVAAATEADFALNSGDALTAGNAYTYAFNASAGYTYNFRVGTATTVSLWLDRMDAKGDN